MKRLKTWSTAIAALMLSACASIPPGLGPIQTVDELDVERYQGQWYVIANIPYFAERGKVRPRVIYQPRDDGRMDDLYFYRKDFGEPEKSMEGVAWIPDSSQPGVWKTRFRLPASFRLVSGSGPLPLSCWSPRS